MAYGFHGARPYISTVRGRRFYVDAPNFDIDEMAHALGMICRFGGHSTQFYPVAEHALLVSVICERLQLADPFEGLMHDGHEAYLVDLPKPWKAIVGGYEHTEAGLQRAMRLQFKLPPVISPGCKMADWIALAIEARALLPNRGDDILWPAGVRDKAMTCGLTPMCLSPEPARTAFLARYDVLTRKRPV